MPNLTTKELTALEDLLGYEQVLVKKYRTMATQCTDNQLKNSYEKISNRHQQHYDTLANHLQ